MVGRVNCWNSNLDYYQKFPRKMTTEVKDDNDLENRMRSLERFITLILLGWIAYVLLALGVFLGVLLGVLIA